MARGIPWLQPWGGCQRLLNYQKATRIALGLATFALLAGCGSTAASTTVSKDKGLAAAYFDAVGPAAISLGNAMTATGTACNATMNECRASLAHDRDLAYVMQKAMNDHPAPACMGPAPHDYTAGINLFIQGTSDKIRGMDNNDAPAINKGTGEVTRATALINKANAELSKGTC